MNRGEFLLNVLHLLELALELPLPLLQRHADHPDVEHLVQVHLERSLHLLP